MERLSKNLFRYKGVKIRRVAKDLFKFFYVGFWFEASSLKDAVNTIEMI